jgi:transcriptional regulator with XRE-family HTH domain
MERSHQPFPQTLRKLLSDQGVSQRELARRTRRHGWGSVPAVNLLANDQLDPTIPAMEAIARALEVNPDYFAEYRLAIYRRDFDPKQVGLKKALRNLDAT